MLVLAVRTARAVPKPSIKLLLNRIQEMLTHDRRFIVCVRFLPVLSRDDSFELFLIPHLDGVLARQLERASLLLPRRDIQLVRVLALIRRLRAATVLEKLAKHRLRVHSWL